MKTTIWNGTTYKSRTDAAKANYVSVSAMSKRANKGMTCEADVGKSWGGYNRIPVEWEGVQYESLTAAAQACGITRQAMHKRLKKRRM